MPGDAPFTRHAEPREIARPISVQNERPGGQASRAEGSATEVHSTLHDLEEQVQQMRQNQLVLEEQNLLLTESKAELEAATARYRDLFLEAPVGLLTIGIQGKILLCNRRGADLLRLTPQYATRRRITEFMSPVEAKVFGEHLERLYRTQEPITLETEMRRADGRQFWSELAMHLVPGSSDESFVCRVALTDQTERRRLLGQNARLAAIVASSAQAVFSVSLDGTVTSWNSGAERLFGYSMKEMIGQSVAVLVPASHGEEEEALRARAVRGEVIDGETVRVDRNGARVPVFVSASPIKSDSGRVVGVAHIMRDVSEQVAAREHVARLLESLREADRRKDDFIATLAHELRNPLAPIRNAAAVLRFSPDLSPKLAWCRDVIDRQVGHMAALLEDLLDVSRLTRDKITLRNDRVEIGTAIAQAVELNKPIIESRHQKLSVSLPSHPIVVHGDLTRLTQIFGNLLNNASKYTDANGDIAVSTEEIDNHLVVSVRDNGIGIRKENLATIFDLFAQVETSRGGQESGLGIGLALVKGLVERHGGTIAANSSGLGQGSEFVVSLPVAPEPHAAAPVEGNTLGGARHGGRALRVLIVDDNVDSAESLAMIVQTRNHEVHTAFDGESAYALAEEFRPHIAVLDIGMPRMNGFQVAERIRRAPWGQNVVLVACTGWGQAEDRRRSHDAGFDRHLVKPISAKAIFDLIAPLENAVE